MEIKDFDKALEQAFQDLSEQLKEVKEPERKILIIECMLKIYETYGT